MSGSIRIRTATEADAAVLLALYRPFVETSAVSFETVAAICCGVPPNMPFFTIFASPRPQASVTAIEP